MKEFKDIEKKLRNGKLPDSDMSSRHNDIWRKIISHQRKRRKAILPIFLSPWVWALASIIVVFLFLIFIFLIK